MALDETKIITIHPEETTFMAIHPPNSFGDISVKQKCQPHGEKSGDKSSK